MKKILIISLFIGFIISVSASNYERGLATIEKGKCDVYELELEVKKRLTR